MNTREPITEPLDDDEREFARVVRALPAGEPPAALDARILKAASDAVAARPRRRFAWLAGGSAALEVVAKADLPILGLAVLVHYSSFALRGHRWQRHLRLQLRLRSLRGDGAR